MHLFTCYHRFIIESVIHNTVRSKLLCVFSGRVQLSPFKFLHMHNNLYIGKESA